MITLFNTVSQECSALITKRYSTSFSLGIRMFDKRFRPPIYNIYGFVRFADEIVDTFHDYDKARLLKEFETETYKAIDEGISLNPVLNAFQLTVNQYKIDTHLIQAFIDSMAMDLDHSIYDEELYNKYIYGSAEVVGLMCLKVFCEGDEAKYESLKPSACKLGAAFQKVNFLRDMKSDFDIRERVYFPGVDFQNFTEKDKTAIQKDIETDFQEAYEGIKQLPKGARLGVYIAFVYYKKLLKKIEATSAQTITKKRLRVPDTTKAALLLSSTVKNKLNFL